MGRVRDPELRTEQCGSPGRAGPCPTPTISSARARANMDGRDALSRTGLRSEPKAAPARKSKVTH